MIKLNLFDVGEIIESEMAKDVPKRFSFEAAEINKAYGFLTPNVIGFCYRCLFKGEKERIPLGLFVAP